MARADDDHTTPLSVSGKPFRLTIILLSALVRCLALSPIKPQHPPLVVRPRQFHQVSALRLYFPSSGLNGFPSALRQLALSEHLVRIVYGQD